MSKHLLKVCNTHSEEVENLAPVTTWDNFCKYYHDNNFVNVDSVLKEFNARNIVNTVYVEFDTEEDMTLFVLRFGS